MAIYYRLCKSDNLQHSSKGSSWKEHKYIKRIDGTYYYPDSYEGGRHLPDNKNKETTDHNSNDMKKILDGIAERGGFSKYQELINDKDYSKGGDQISNFRLFMEEFGGLDSSKYTDEEIKNMMNKLEETKDSKKLSESDINNLAKEVIRGNFGNGQIRKDLLGDNYAEIQKRVNELIRGSAGSKKISEASDEFIKRVEKASKKISSLPSNKKISGKQIALRA